jgi:protocatechuate 3,4-dioxygenase beta subunit
MRDDDRMVGRVLTRRELVGLLGLSGVAVLIDPLRAQAPAPSGGAPVCVVQPEQMEGPYFSDVMLNRADVRSDPPSTTPKAGAVLALTLNVTQIAANGACTALSGAHVDIWQCDALGVYSDAKDPSFNTVGQKFLRGYQLTDKNGVARFTTIYPGWYPGRAVHIHFKIRTNPKGPSGQEFTSQLYFDEALTDRVHASQPYASKGKGRTPNEKDGIFKDGGRQLILAVSEKAGGYAGAFNVALVKKT